MTKINVEELFKNKSLNELFKWSDEDLMLFHSVLHNYYEPKKKKQDIPNIHSSIVAELKKRGKTHHGFDGLDEVSG